MFSFRQTKSGTVFIYWNQAHVVTLAGADATSFVNRMAGADDKETQLIMAKATGDFKRGNERVVNSRPGSGRTEPARLSNQHNYHQ